MADNLIVLNDAQILNKENGWVGTVKNIKDINLKMKKGRQQFWAGGLYDYGIFGSPESKGCACHNRFKEVGKKCPICRVEIKDDFEYATEYATYKSEIPFVPFISVPAIINELRKVITIPQIDGFTTNTNGYLWSLYLKQSKEEFDGSTRFFDKNGNSIFVKLTELPDENDLDENDSIANAGLFGLLTLGNLYDIDGVRLEKIRNLIHNQIIISSPYNRPIGFANGTYTVPPETVSYRAIISFSREVSEILAEYSIVDAMSICALFNTMVNRLYGDNVLLQSSKESLTRTIIDTRVGKSFRATIVSKLYDDDMNPVPMNTIYVPWYQFYATMQHDIIRRLQNQLIVENLNSEIVEANENAKTLYKNRDSRAVKIADELMDESMVILTRNPTLSKFSQFAFYIRKWNQPCIGLPIAVDAPYTADHDGDTVACWVYNDPNTVAKLRKMTPDHIWTYDKYYTCPYTFTNELAYGLYMATVIRRTEGGIICFNSFEDAERAYQNDEIKVNQLIKIDDKHTTYGRQKISNILNGVNLDEFIAQSNVTFDKKNADSLKVLNERYIDPRGINKENMELFMRLIGGLPLRTQIYADLQKFIAEVNTISGLGVVPYQELYSVSNEEIQNVLNDDNYDKKLSSAEIAMLKKEKLRKLYKESIEKNLDDIPDNNIRELMVSAGKVKIPALVEVYCPSINGETNESITSAEWDSYFDGITEQSYIAAASHDRGTLQLKQDNVPSSGFVQRQLNDACWNTIYHANEESPDKIGILMKGEPVIGRVDVNTGRIYDKAVDNYVRVKSCVTNGVENAVYRDELAQFKYSINDGASIGASFASALVEPITQAGLSLKHGGDILQLNTYVTTALEDGTIIEVSDRFITIEGNHKYKYLITKCCILSDKVFEGSDVKQGNILLTKYEKKKTDYQISQMTTILQAQVAGETGAILPRNYSYIVTTGLVEYSDNYITVGNINYPIDEDSIYFYPQGYEITEVAERVSSGIPHLGYLSQVTDDIGVLYCIFYKFITSVFKGFNSEPLELIFKNIMTANYSLKTALYTNNSLIDRLYFGNATKNISTSITKAVSQSQIEENSKVAEKIDVDESVRIELNKRKLETNKPTKVIVGNLQKSINRNSYNEDFVNLITTIFNDKELDGTADWETIREILDNKTDKYGELKNSQLKDSIIEWLNNDSYASKLLPYITVNRDGISIKIIEDNDEVTDVPIINLGQSIVTGIIMNRIRK